VKHSPSPFQRALKKKSISAVEYTLEYIYSVIIVNFFKENFTYIEKRTAFKTNFPIIDSKN